MPLRAQRAIAVLGQLVVIGFAAALVQQGWAFVELGRLQQTPVMGLSKAWVYLAMPTGGALIILFSLIPLGDRKSTRLNSSHGYISYAVFCLKKKKRKHRLP